MNEIRDELMFKIEHSIALLRKGERLATDMNPDGYWLAFSGGKDSQCIYELGKMSGVKFKAHYSVTTLDAPKNVYFIKKNYPEVEFIHPKRTFLQLVEDHRSLPTMKERWCCAKLKEANGNKCVKVTGVRAEESSKRSKYTEIRRYATTEKQKNENKMRAFDGIEELEHIYSDGGGGGYRRSVKAKNWLMSPILQWTERDVWEFIEYRNLPINPCYEDTGRVGCIFCPFASAKALNFAKNKYPKHYRLLMRSIERIVEKGYFNKYGKLDAETIWDWWISKESAKDYFEKKKQLELF